MKFDKTDTLAVKGIAIMLMIQHHGFLAEDRFAKYDVLFTPFSQSFIVSLSSFMKICVGMYVFLSGYGLALSLKKYSPEYKLGKKQYEDYMLRRTFKLMAGYWLIYILAFIINMIYNQRPISIYFSKGIMIGAYDMLIDFSGLAYMVVYDACAVHNNFPALCGKAYEKIRSCRSSFFGRVHTKDHRLLRTA